MLLEVIAANLIDIQLIAKSKADKIEFCSELKAGGLTPAFADVEIACSLAKQPINVMLRSTDRSFIYTDTEFEQMLKQLKKLVLLPINGIVFGALKTPTEIDYQKVIEVVKIAKENNKQVTFHKAFDQVNKKLLAIKELSKLGVDTILTSGGPNIIENIDELATLKGQTPIKILAGGGVNFSNIDRVIPIVDEVHVGSSIRDYESWDYPVNLDLIAKIKTIIDKSTKNQNKN